MLLLSQLLFQHEMAAPLLLTISMDKPMNPRPHSHLLLLVKGCSSHRC